MAIMDMSNLMPGAVADGQNSYKMGGTLFTPFAGSVYKDGQWVRPGSLNSLSYEQVKSDANPWAPEAAKYTNQLAELMSNPGSSTTNPMYEFTRDQGLEAINRTAAARGNLGSGNRLAELMKYGTGLASQNFFQMADLLGGLSGSKTYNPAAGVNAGLSLLNMQERGNNPGSSFRMSSGSDLSKLNLTQLY